MPYLSSFLRSGVAERRRLQRAASRLAPASAARLRRWRRRSRDWPAFSTYAQVTVERLLRPDLLLATMSADRREQALDEEIDYIARRLAKLGVPLDQVTAALADFGALVQKDLLNLEPAEVELARRIAAFGPAIGLRLARGYARVQQNALQTLLGVLDAELGARTLGDLLPRLVELAVNSFGAVWGEILLLQDGAVIERVQHGFGPELVLPEAPLGTFFRRVLASRQPGFILDAASDPRVGPPWFRTLEVKSVWAVALRARDAQRPAIGLLHVAFDRIYECLPQERELLQALAERSALAVERVRLTDSLREQRQRVSQLSRQLVAAQEEERRRIGRDLHDETGQSLMLLRLHLEMGLRKGNGDRALRQALTVVDRSIEELRRILARLSPLMLDELGLEAALRRELRQLRDRTEGRIGTRFRFKLNEGALDRELRILLYRVIQEGLNNVARHAQAQHVSLSLAKRDGALQAILQDDGVGISPERRRDRSRFGLSGMRERLRLAGGDLNITRPPGGGTRLEMMLPLAKGS